jgi:hypothetical protein
MSFKSFHITVVGSGRAATGFAIASAILVAFLFFCYRYFQSFNAILVVSISFIMATRQCRRLASLAAALHIPHAIFHQLSLVAIHIKPLRGLTEFTFPCSPPSPFFFKREGRCVLFYLLLFPLSNSVREGELKGVSKNTSHHHHEG